LLEPSGSIAAVLPPQIPKPSIISGGKGIKQQMFGAES